MDLSARLYKIRKHKGLTRKMMALSSGVNLNQIRRYEIGLATPSLEALKRIAQALRVTADSLIFDESERLPENDLLLQFRAVSEMTAEQQYIVKQLIEGMIIKYETERWSSRMKGE
ncbi:helix-turn-helix domain-containing protein [Dryocola clanedunensis]|uniref:helix-turn-helix domain-containing protein n=1 Tax=Cedecea sulfonylureivorans TaxID=3051154 RepID=UPI0019254C69|nr:helix-turn-helix transcriptional regulator [Cedecea sulfonylureivorans]